LIFDSHFGIYTSMVWCVSWCRLGPTWERLYGMQS